MFPSRKVSDIFTSMTAVLRLSYDVAAQQRCIVKAKRDFLISSMAITTAHQSPVQSRRVVLLPAIRWPGPVDCWLLGQLPFSGM